MKPPEVNVVAKKKPLFYFAMAYLAVMALMNNENRFNRMQDHIVNNIQNFFKIKVESRGKQIEKIN